MYSIETHSDDWNRHEGHVGDIKAHQLAHLHLFFVIKRVKTPFAHQKGRVNCLMVKFCNWLILRDRAVTFNRLRSRLIGVKIVTLKGLDPI